jgi:hypothetical protein
MAKPALFRNELDEKAKKAIEFLKIKGLDCENI